jgi:hypothetical protein
MRKRKRDTEKEILSERNRHIWMGERDRAGGNKAEGEKDAERNRGE